MGSSRYRWKTEEIVKPTHCPACGTELIQDGVHIFCPNSLNCKPQLVSRIVHFASRDAMNIEGLSEKNCRKTIWKLDLMDVADIYEIKYEDLMNWKVLKKKRPIIY